MNLKVLSDYCRKFITSLIYIIISYKSGHIRFYIFFFQEERLAFQKMALQKARPSCVALEKDFRQAMNMKIGDSILGKVTNHRKYILNCHVPIS